MTGLVSITQQLVRSTLFNEGIDAESFGAFTSPRYALPSREWIAGKFADYWQRIRSEFHYSFTPGSQVCHHFAQGCAVFAGLCHDSTEGKPTDSALCFGELWFPRPPKSHAVNFALVWERGYPVFVGFEPQTGKIIELTQAERNKCHFLRV